MRRLNVFIEFNGCSVFAGELTGNDSGDACFIYADSYLSNPEFHSISISLPKTEKTFDAVRTRNFFEGLLPEGFTRKCVAEQIHADEGDYLSILAGLGKECLGAVKIIEEGAAADKPAYRPLPMAEVRRLAQEGVTESAQLVAKAHLSLTGASGKAGLYYDASNNRWYLPVGEAPSTHIVKQSHVRLKQIVANEQLCLLTAGILGLKVPESFIVKTQPDADGADSEENSEEVLFAVKRYDRIILPEHETLNGLAVPCRLHQEDFAQALGIAASEKYEKNRADYLKQAFELLRLYSADPIADQLMLWDICVFNYLIGNTDNHIKNLSLLYGPDLRTVRLAPAYDMLSTMIYESSSENMAMSIGGLYNIREIGRDSFAKEAKHVGLGIKPAMTRFDAMAGRFEEALRAADGQLAAQGFAQAEAISERILQKGGISSYRKENR